MWTGPTGKMCAETMSEAIQEELILTEALILKVQERFLVTGDHVVLWREEKLSIASSEEALKPARNGQV